MKRKLNAQEIHDRSVVKFYFPNLDTPVIISKDGKTKHRVDCRCGSTRLIKPKSGLTNCWQHIRSQHPDYETEYESFQESLVDMVAEVGMQLFMLLLIF